MRFAASVWLPQGARGEPPPFDPAVLREGDLLAIDGWMIDGALAARGVLLLFAADDRSWRHRPEPVPFRLHWSPQAASRWGAFTESVRRFFVARGFNEARTPTLVPSPGTEPFLEPFVTKIVFGSSEAASFLPTSPEFHLKKLLAGGFTRVFELKECFRNNESGSHHQFEFLMLEWYRAYSNLDAIAADCDELMAAAAAALGVPAPASLVRVTMRDLFQRRFGFELSPSTPKTDLLRLAADQAVAVDATDTWDEVFFRLFLARIEPELAADGPWLVAGYPPSQAALARIGPDGWADRFEIYWKGLEIANAFHELNDPDANVERFRRDSAERAASGKPPVPHDEELVNALYQGLPPSGGIALGMDRLFMALTGIERIEDTRAFPRRGG